MTSAESAGGQLREQRLDPRSWDDDSRTWVAELTSTGTARDVAVGRLYALMVRMARAEAARRTGGPCEQDFQGLLQALRDEARRSERGTRW